MALFVVSVVLILLAVAGFVEGVAAMVQVKFNPHTDLED